MLKNEIKYKAFINNYLHELLNKIDQYDRKIIYSVFFSPSDVKHVYSNQTSFFNSLYELTWICIHSERFSFHRQAFERLCKLCQQINQFMRWIPKDHMNEYSWNNPNVLIYCEGVSGDKDVIISFISNPYSHTLSHT
jgi:hypothetical protein